MKSCILRGMTTNYCAQSLDIVAAVDAVAVHLDDLVKDTTAPDRNARIAAANREIGRGLKLAQIYALLDIAEALRAGNHIADVAAQLP